MEYFSRFLPLLLIFSLLFSSCSKQDPSIDDNVKEKEEIEEIVGKICDYSDPVKSGVEVVDYDMTDGSIAITTTVQKAPKNGDILCSGSTDQAPLGYILRVVEIEEVDQSLVDEYRTKSGTKSEVKDGVTYIVRTIPARLEDLLRSRGKEAEGWLSISNGKVKLAATDTKSIWNYYKAEEQGIPLLHIKPTYQLKGDTKDNSDKNHVKWEDYGDLNLSLSLSEYLSAYDIKFYTDPKSNTKSGMKLQFFNHFNVHMSGAGGYHIGTDDLVTYFTDKLNPIENHTSAKKYENAWYPVIPLEVIGLPINITFRIVVRWPFDASISAGIDADLYDNQSYFAFGAMWDEDGWGLTPLEESGGEYFFTEEVPEDSKAVKEADAEKSKFGMYLKGEVKTGPVIEFSAGINGTNLTSDEIQFLLETLSHTDDAGSLFDFFKEKKESDKEEKEKTWNFKCECLTCGGEVGLDFGAKVEMGYEYVSDNPIEELLNINPNIAYDKRIKDKWSITGDVNAKAYFTLLDLGIGYKGIDFFDLKWKKDFSFNLPLFKYSGSFLFPEFKNQEVEAYPDDYIKISGTKIDPFATWFYKQDGMGYVLEKYKTGNGQYFEDPGSFVWTKIDKTECKYSMTLPIKTSDLELNVPYTLYPYVKVSKAFHLPDSKFNIYRKGVKFVYDGHELRFNTIEPIYGEDL